MREPGAEQREQAKYYQISVCASTYAELIIAYQQKKLLSWSLNTDNFNIKLWPTEKGYHNRIDPDGNIKGYIQNDRLDYFADNQPSTPEEKKAILSAIKQFLTTPPQGT